MAAKEPQTLCDSSAYTRRLTGARLLKYAWRPPDGTRGRGSPVSGHSPTTAGGSQNGNEVKGLHSGSSLDVAGRAHSHSEGRRRDLWTVLCQRAKMGREASAGND